MKSNVYTFFPSPLATAPTPELAGLGLKSLQTQPIADEKPPPPAPQANSDDEVLQTSLASLTMTDTGEDEDAGELSALPVGKVAQKPENFMLGFLWLLYLSWMARTSM